MLLAAIETHAQRPQDEAILSECSPCKIVIQSVLWRQGGELLSKERMQALIEAAASDKVRKAAKRLQAARRTPIRTEQYRRL